MSTFENLLDTLDRVDRGARVVYQVEVGNDTDGWLPYGQLKPSAGTAARVANDAEKTYRQAPTIEVRVVRVTETREVL